MKIMHTSIGIDSVKSFAKSVVTNSCTPGRNYQVVWQSESHGLSLKICGEFMGGTLE